MTVIEIRPHRWGWKVFKILGVEPVFLDQEQAIEPNLAWQAADNWQCNLRRDEQADREAERQPQKPQTDPAPST
jgi:hypothetical protein